MNAKTSIYALAFGRLALRLTPGFDGVVINNDNAAKSSHRAAVSDAPAKLSFAAVALEWLLDATSVAVSEVGEKTLLVEHFNAKQETDFIGLVTRTDSNTLVKYYGSAGILDTRYEAQGGEMLCAVAYDVLFGNNTELRQHFAEIVKKYKATQLVELKDSFLFCDSYYYGSAGKDGQNIETETMVSAEEVDGLVRLKGLKKISLLEHTNHVVSPRFSKKRKTKNAAVKRDVVSVFTDAINGQYVVPFAWDSSQEEYIQPLSQLNGFVPSKTFADILEKIRFRSERVISRINNGLDISKASDRLAAIGNDYINLTLTGKPGTGKTRLIHALGAATGMPVYVVSNSHNTDEDEYQGMTKMVDGKPTAVITDTMRCYEHGGILVLEEINLPMAAVVMGSLGQAVEYPFILKKDGYIPVRRHPLCIIISTMNTGTAGSKVLSQPFANRFKQSYILDDPEKGNFIKILSQIEPNEVICSWVYECYDRIVNCIKQDNAVADIDSILLSLSMRSCVGALENIQEGCEAREAVRNSIIGKIAEQDMEVAMSCEKVLKSIPDPKF